MFFPLHGSIRLPQAVLGGLALWIPSRTSSSAGTTEHVKDASGNRTGKRYETCNNTYVFGKACGSCRILHNHKNQDITLIIDIFLHSAS